MLSKPAIFCPAQTWMVLCWQLNPKGNWRIIHLLLSICVSCSRFTLMSRLHCVKARTVVKVAESVPVYWAIRRNCRKCWSFGFPIILARSTAWPVGMCTTAWCADVVLFIFCHWHAMEESSKQCSAWRRQSTNCVAVTVGRLLQPLTPQPSHCHTNVWLMLALLSERGSDVAVSSE